MTKEEYKAIVAEKEYDFLRNDKRLSDIMILGLGGSHAYGTNVEGVCEVNERIVCRQKDRQKDIER